MQQYRIIAMMIDNVKRNNVNIGFTFHLYCYKYSQAGKSLYDEGK